MAEVLVALSGGVDSAVAAAQLVSAGHRVTGVHLKLAEVDDADQIPGQGCCTLDDAQDARRTADVLGIPFYVWDLTATFRDRVQRPFAHAFAAGRTPNPCVDCNEQVKYAALLDRALDLGFDGLATGHHAALRSPDGTPVTTPTPGARLVRGADPRKDQSYVLSVARPEQLAATVLPIGELTKDQVRAQASDLGLRVAAKPDSYDICFIPDGDTAGYLAGHVDPAPGKVVDVDGNVLGEHEGVWRYTVGQRRNLGLTTGTHTRRFVVDLDAASGTVVVGPRDALRCGWLAVDAPSWAVADVPADDAQVRVQIRAHAPSVPARLRHDRQGWRVELVEPLHGVALGQVAALYDAADRICLGGGRISGADRPAGLPLTAASA